jgi:hypothetical protein
MTKMRFIVMHKVDAAIEAGDPPSPEILERMGELIGESTKAGVCLDGAGLHRSARRVRVSPDGKAEHGPYAGENELVQSMAMIKAKSMEEATGHAARFSRAAGSVEIEIGPVVEAWDLGLMPKPKSEYERFLFLVKGNAKTESGESPSPEERGATTALSDELRRAGVLLQRMALAPSSKGKRAAASKDKRQWIDGPFAESKELISGFAVLELPSVLDAIAWADRYAAILGHNEVDIRELAD